MFVADLCLATHLSLNLRYGDQVHIIGFQRILHQILFSAKNDLIFFQKRLPKARKRIKLAVCERNILFWEQTPECFFHSLPFMKE